MQQPPGDNDIDKYYLYPGKIFASKKPHIVGTLLGSCVAVFLWDPVLLFGSVNHYMLPVWNKEGEPSCKYGDIAIAKLIVQMLKLGSCKNNIKAKIFGGSEITNAHGTFNIGERNICLAQDMLASEQVPIISHSVGGSLGRKAMFYTASGDVLISYLKNDIAVIDQQSKNSGFNLSKK